MLTLPQEPGPRHRLYETMVEHTSLHGPKMATAEDWASSDSVVRERAG